MKWLLVIGAVAAVGVLAIVVFGWLQPVKHSVTRSIHLKAASRDVFALLDDIEQTPGWSSGILKAERLPDRNGQRSARYTLRWRGREMIMTELERNPPSRLVISMAPPGAAPLGTWTYELGENNGCDVSLTEDGELKNPLMRAFARMHGLDTSIRTTLQDLAKKFGETADIR
jgi:hypothetical protein